MKIVVTGADGFIGKNLCVFLRERGYDDIAPLEVQSDNEAWKTALSAAD